MANEITGRDIIVALVKTEAWGTPRPAGAGDGLLINADNIKVSIPSELDDSAGQEWIAQADEGAPDLKGSIDSYMRYEGFDTALALIMGTAGVPTLLGALAHSNSYSLSTNILGRCATMAQQKLANKVWEYPSVKLHGFKLSAEMNKPVKLSLNVIANTLDRASAVNTIGTMANVTYPDAQNRIIMNKDTVIRINDQSGAALSGTDALTPSSIEFTFNRPMDSQPVAGQAGIEEPIDNGFPACTCTMKFPRYNTANDAFFDDWDAFTSKKMDITFVGKLIETGYRYKFVISCPHVTINNPAASVSGPGKIPFSLSFDILAAQAAPGGMSHTTPFKIEVVNTRSTDPLAWNGIENSMGNPGGVGFGVGIVPGPLSDFTLLSSDPADDNYGNYQYKDGSICLWRPMGWIRIGHVDNPTYPTYGLNSIDIKPELYFADSAAANAVGYSRHRAFIDGGANQRGFMRDKYFCSKTGAGAGFIASSIKNGLPISTNAAHNPIADLTACSTNSNDQVINAAHARDGIDGAVNPASIWHASSKYQRAWVQLLSMAHAQAANRTTYCAWYDSSGVINFPKGCNNNALGDVNDAAVSYTSDGYSNCGKTGSGIPFEKTTCNGQACGEADVNGLMWEANIGLTCIAASHAIEAISSAVTPVFTKTAHGLSPGSVIQIDAITQADWVNFSSRLWAIATTPDADTFTLTGAPDTSLYTAYDPVTDPGTFTFGTFYAASSSTSMKDFTAGNTLATDHWGPIGIAAMMEPLSPVFETGYPGNGYSQRYGDGAGQVLSEAMSGNNYVLTGLGFPSDSAGVSASGTNLFGQDYFYQYLRNELCLLSGGYWSNSSSAGAWSARWNSYRANSYYSVGFRLACYCYPV